MKIGQGKKEMTTQYGFHKYLVTDHNALLPFYELKFNAVGLPKEYWSEVCSTLDSYGYFVRNSDDKIPTKVLWIGDLSLSDRNIDKQIGNLIEALFAVTVLKSLYKGNEKGTEFSFLHSI
ncbi:hypothetical protein GH741_02825 [Aquibacillus halophilus]|uniref:Uncharacterized protein n=1 Tax=Aquibacillus halophilus TaxID=930132 RepID=A0A6A8D777_9BACI|nr:hypothetical protein [Aquibacillus halophilus]